MEEYVSCEAGVRSAMLDLEIVAELGADAERVVDVVHKALDESAVLSTKDLRSYSAQLDNLLEHVREASHFAGGIGDSTASLPREQQANYHNLCRKLQRLIGEVTAVNERVRVRLIAAEVAEMAADVDRLASH